MLDVTDTQREETLTGFCPCSGSERIGKKLPRVECSERGYLRNIEKFSSSIYSMDNLLRPSTIPKFHLKSGTLTSSQTDNPQPPV
jgi:hypothetical protein